MGTNIKILELKIYTYEFPLKSDHQDDDIVGYNRHCNRHNKYIRIQKDVCINTIQCIAQKMKEPPEK